MIHPRFSLSILCFDSFGFSSFCKAAFLLFEADSVDAVLLDKVTVGFSQELLAVLIVIVLGNGLRA